MRPGGRECLGCRRLHRLAEGLGADGGAGRRLLLLGGRREREGERAVCPPLVSCPPPLQRRGRRLGLRGRGRGGARRLWLLLHRAGPHTHTASTPESRRAREVPGRCGWAPRRPRRARAPRAGRGAALPAPWPAPGRAPRPSGGGRSFRARETDEGGAGACCAAASSRSARSASAPAWMMRCRNALLSSSSLPFLAFLSRESALLAHLAASLSLPWTASERVRANLATGLRGWYVTALRASSSAERGRAQGFIETRAGAVCGGGCLGVAVLADERLAERVQSVY